jgi:DNA-binding NtrC family response regulator
LLIIENDARIVELLRWFLERRGHRVRAASSFAQARAAIAEHRPDLVLSDIELGGENARTMLPVLARAGELPPTLVVSGYLDHDLAREMLAIPGVVGVLAKPFEFERLERCIEEQLTRAQPQTIARSAP